jgi:hypothetical protein
MNFRSVLHQWMTRETTSTVGSEAYNKKNLQKKQVYKHVDEETGEIYFSHHMSGKPVTGGSEDWSVEIHPSGQPFYIDRKARRSTWTKPAILDFGSPDRALVSDTIWDAEVDETGNSYYVNRKTRRSTWTRPSMLDDDDLQKVGALSDKDSESTDLAASTTTWETVVDEDTGKMYYSNRKSRRSTWTRPKELGEINAAKETTQSDQNENKNSTGSNCSLAPLNTVKEDVEDDTRKITDTNASFPSNIWDAEVEVNTGKMYYVNRKSRRSTWTRPDNLVLSENSTKKTMVDDTDLENNTQTISNREFEKDIVHESIGSGDWEEHIDAETGKQYYLDKKQRRTTWTRPCSNAKEPRERQSVRETGEVAVDLSGQRATSIRPDLLNEADRDSNACIPGSGGPVNGAEQMTSPQRKKQNGVFRFTAGRASVMVGKMAGRRRAKTMGTRPSEPKQTRGVGTGATGRASVMLETTRGSVRGRGNTLGIQPKGAQIGARKQSVFARLFHPASGPKRTDTGENPKCSRRGCTIEVYLDKLCVKHFKEEHIRVQKESDERRKKFFGD